MSTIFSLKEVDAVCRALVQQYNALHQATVSVTADGYHRDVSGVSTSGDFSAPSSSALSVSATAAVDLATTLALALNIQGVMGVHFADDAAHLKADTVNVAFDGYLIDSTSSTTKLNSVIAMLNAEKVNFNAHLSQSGVHLKTDAGNVVSTTDASDLSTSEALANQLKTSVNAHMSSGPSVGRIKLID